MALDNQDIIFASLMGAGKVESLERFNSIQNELSKHVLPPIPFLPIKHIDKKKGLWETEEQINKNQQFFPLTFSFEGSSDEWIFPYEPIISISGGNNIIKRNVAKQGDDFIGTVKERWSQKDYEITITGVLIGSLLKGKPEECYPAVLMENLLKFLKDKKSIKVNSYPLNKLGITQIVIEDFSFPFTKGENVQAYEIKAVSDHAYNLLIEK